MKNFITQTLKIFAILLAILILMTPIVYHTQGFDALFHKILTYVARSYEIKADFDKVQILRDPENKQYFASINNIKLKDYNILIDQAKLHCSLRDLLNFKLNLTVDAINLGIISPQNQQRIMNTDLKIELQRKFNSSESLIKIQSTNFTVVNLHSIAQKNLVSCQIYLNNPSEISNCSFNLNLNKDSTLNFKTTNISNKKLRLDVSAHKISWDYYYLFKPWITNNSLNDILETSIKSGMIEDGQLQVDLNQNNLMIIPDTLRGKFELRDLEIKYSADYPSINKIRAKLELENLKMKFTVLEAYALQNRLQKNGLVELDLNTDMKMKIIANFIGPINNIQHFIPSETVNQLNKHLNLSKTVGELDTSLAIFFSATQNKQLIMNIESEGKNLTIPSNHYGLKLHNYFLKAKLNNSRIMIQGDGKLNGSKSSLNYLAVKEKHNDLYSHSMQLTTLFHGKLPKNDYLHLDGGETNLIAKYKASASGNHNFKIQADLSKTKFNVIPLHFTKRGIYPMDLQIQSTDNQLSKFSIILQSPREHANGKFEINQHKGNLDFNNYYLSFSQLKTNLLELQADLHVKQNHYDIKIRGSKLNLVPWIAEVTSGLMTTDKLPGSISLDARIDTINLNYDINLKNNQLKALFSPEKLKSLDFTAKIGSRDLTISFNKTIAKKEDSVPISKAVTSGDKFNIPTKNVWRIYTSNVGAFLYGLDIYTKMRAGSLEAFFWQKEDNAKADVFLGNFNLERFVIIDPPLITSTLSYISAPGMMNIITNNNNKVKFSLTQGDIKVQDGIFYFEKVMTEGPDLEYTLDASVDTNIHQVDMRGYVYPTWFGANYLTRRIPLLNKIFTGKRKGLLWGPFAIRYKY